MPSSQDGEGRDGNRRHGRRRPQFQEEIVSPSQTPKRMAQTEVGTETEVATTAYNSSHRGITDDYRDPYRDQISVPEDDGRHHSQHIVNRSAIRSDVTRTSRTGTNAAYTRNDTDYETTHTEGTTERAYPLRREGNEPVRSNTPTGNHIYAKLGRYSVNLKARPSRSNFSEVATSMTSNRSSIRSTLRSHFTTDPYRYDVRFEDLQIICPRSFRHHLMTWEQFAARDYEVGLNPDPAAWFHDQRNKVMDNYAKLNDFWVKNHRE